MQKQLHKSKHFADISVLNLDAWLFLKWGGVEMNFD